MDHVLAVSLDFSLFEVIQHTLSEGAAEKRNAKYVLSFMDGLRAFSEKGWDLLIINLDIVEDLHKADLMAAFRGANSAPILALLNEKLTGGFVALLAVLFVTPLTVTELAPGYTTSSISTDILGAQGLFTAIIVSISAVALFSFLTNKNIAINLPEAVPDFVAKSFAGIPAAILTMVPFVVVRCLFAFTSYGSLNDFIYGAIQTPLVALGNSLPSHLICMFLISLLWWFGIHGSTVVFSVMMSMWQVPMIENITAVAQGLAPIHILSLISFFVVHQFFGGPGCLFGLYVNNFFFAKSERLKAHKKLSSIPGFFNIIEPAVYGIPIAYNPILLAPFLLTPIVIYVAYFVLASIGVIGIPVVNLAIMIIPGPIAGFLLGGGISFGIFVLAGLALSCLIYFPFFKVLDKQALREEQASLSTAKGE